MGIKDPIYQTPKISNSNYDQNNIRNKSQKLVNNSQNFLVGNGGNMT